MLFNDLSTTNNDRATIDDVVTPFVPSGSEHYHLYNNSRARIQQQEQVQSYQLQPQQQPPQVQYSCLYTKHKVQKKKIWYDGRLVVQNCGIELYSATNPVGNDPIQDQWELSRPELDLLVAGNYAAFHTIETEKFLISIEGPWKNQSIPTTTQLNTTTNNNGQTTKVVSSSMENLLNKKFRKPSTIIPPNPDTQQSNTMTEVLGKRRRPLQPGELVRRYYPPAMMQQQQQQQFQQQPQSYTTRPVYEAVQPNPSCHSNHNSTSGNPNNIFGAQADGSTFRSIHTRNDTSQPPVSNTMVGQVQYDRLHPLSASNAVHANQTSVPAQSFRNALDKPIVPTPLLGNIIAATGVPNLGPSPPPPPPPAGALVPTKRITFSENSFNPSSYYGEEESDDDDDNNNNNYNTNNNNDNDEDSTSENIFQWNDNTAGFSSSTPTVTCNKTDSRGNIQTKQSISFEDDSATVPTLSTEQLLGLLTESTTNNDQTNTKAPSNDVFTLPEPDDSSDEED